MTVEGPRPLELATRLADGAGSNAAIVEKLHDVHRRQWELEDLTRSPMATNEQIASAKAEIDASNSVRHEFIDQIDSLVPVGAFADRVYSETVGELCDRLIIFDLKREALRRRGAASTLREADVLHAHLAVVVAQLLTDLAAGRAKLPPRFGLKIYGARPAAGGPQ